ncbi:PREDICTED: coiled-coil domain-containing protein 15, partial [Merops nubicus]|uniref:coiled-coil domain-containing protein 15 n=1 Tax=Merops nubicus TaxID=57421 RepID=UPI0004EFFF06
ALVSRVEEELQEQQQKLARLRRFQGQVKQRVNQQVQLRRKQQLQKSYEAAERESSVATQHLPPRRNICLFRSHQQPVIGGPGAGGGPAWWDGTQTQPFQQQAAELRRAMRQVRRRLASCRTVPQGSGPPELPGGIWRLEKPESCPTATVPTGDESEELLLVGHHDLPAELQGQGTAPPQAELDNDFYIKIKFGKICDASVKDSSSPEPAQKPQTHSQALLMPWDGVDQEETKKQRQREYLRHRRLFMSLEREQVKEQQKQKERQERITQIKSKKENQRQAEEQRMQRTNQRGPSPGEGAPEPLTQLELEEKRVKKVKDKQQRNKEHVRYVEALRAQLREKMKLQNITLPQLCCCGTEFWDSHPDTCANNCVFYKNPKAYSRALRSLLSSCGPTGGGSSGRAPLEELAALCAPR